MPKKLTIKELEQRINILAYNINSIKAVMDNLGMAFSEYTVFKQDQDAFKNYLENKNNVNKLKEDVENDTK